MDDNSSDPLRRLYGRQRPCLSPAEDEQALEGLMSAMVEVGLEPRNAHANATLFAEVIW
jgi:hypothetical protein